MKKLLLTLIVSIAFCGSIFAQYESDVYESYWIDQWNVHVAIPYETYDFLIPFFTIDGEYITRDVDYEAIEVAAFIDGECRGHSFLIDDGETWPFTELAVYRDYTDHDQVITFQMYDHANGLLYNGTTTLLNGDDYHYDELYVSGDYDLVPVLNFTISIVISTSANPLAGGTITGAGTYHEGDVCTLSATANPGYSFLNWTENGEAVSSDAEYSFVVTESRDLVANFFTNHWTAESYQNNMFMVGVVKIDGVEQTSPTLELGAFCNGECRGTEFPFEEGGRWVYFMSIGGNNGDDIAFRLYDHSLQQELNLYCYNALPFQDDVFIGADDPYEVLFTQMFVVSVIVDPENAGTVTGAGTYINGTDVTLTATANENSTFINWTIGDEQVSTDTIYSFTVIEDVTVIANFFLPSYEVSVSVNPMEGGSVSGAGIYENGTSCTLIATTNAGYAFSNWSINGEVVSTEPSYTFTVTSPVNLTANFSVLCSVSVFVSPEGAGTISGMGEYELGTNVTLTAAANEGYAFNSWTLNGDIVSTEPSYTFTVTGSMNLTANFDVVQLTQLAIGWNWFSTNLEITMDDLKAALVAALPEATSITIKSQAQSSLYNGTTWRGRLSTLDVALMYEIHVPASCTITLAGTPINPSEHPITIVPNGNTWIGFPFDESKTLGEAFGTFPVNGDIVKSRDSSASYYGTMWRGRLTDFQPGQGYIYKSASGDVRTLIFSGNTRE